MSIRKIIKDVKEGLSCRSAFSELLYCEASREGNSYGKDLENRWVGYYEKLYPYLSDVDRAEFGNEIIEKLGRICLPFESGNKFLREADFTMTSHSWDMMGSYMNYLEDRLLRVSDFQTNRFTMIDDSNILFSLCNKFFGIYLEGGTLTINECDRIFEYSILEGLGSLYSYYGDNYISWDLILPLIMPKIYEVREDLLGFLDVSEFMWCMKHLFPKTYLENIKPVDVVRAYEFLRTEIGDGPVLPEVEDDNEILDNYFRNLDLIKHHLYFNIKKLPPRIIRIILTTLKSEE